MAQLTGMGGTPPHPPPPGGAEVLRGALASHHANWGERRNTDFGVAAAGDQDLRVLVPMNMVRQQVEAGLKLQVPVIAPVAVLGIPRVPVTARLVHANVQGPVAGLRSRARGAGSHGVGLARRCRPGGIVRAHAGGRRACRACGCSRTQARGAGVTPSRRWLRGPWAVHPIFKLCEGHSTSAGAKGFGKVVLFVSPQRDHFELGRAPLPVSWGRRLQGSASCRGSAAASLCVCSSRAEAFEEGCVTVAEVPIAVRGWACRAAAHQGTRCSTVGEC